MSTLTPEELTRLRFLCDEIIFWIETSTEEEPNSIRLNTDDLATLKLLPLVFTALDQRTKERELDHGLMSEATGIMDELQADRNRLTAQLALEQAASNRTIGHLVERKDALEAQVQALEEELAELRHVGREERDALRVEIARREQIRIGLSKAVDRILAIPDDDDPAMVALRDCFREAVATENAP